MFKIYFKNSQRDTEGKKREEIIQQVKRDIMYQENQMFDL